MVSIEAVSREYHQGTEIVHALRSVSLTIKKGEFLSLCGPSGSGKTTLLNVIGGLDIPTSGTIRIDDTEISSLSSGERAAYRLQNLGFVFQSYNLIPVLSALENVEFVMQLQGVPGRERHERAHSVLEEVGLNGMEHRRPFELSGGQQQRVAVARAIVTNPKMVLADEPTANLDSETAENLLSIMESMNTRHGVTFIFSTHDALVMKHAKRIIHLKDGAIERDVSRAA